MAQYNWIWVMLNATTNGDPVLFKTETNANDWLLRNKPGILSRTQVGPNNWTFGSQEPKITLKKIRILGSDDLGV